MKLKALIGKNVKYYRYRENLTQEQLAEKTKSSVNYIGRLERGQHNPSVDKLEKVASALNIIEVSPIKSSKAPACKTKLTSCWYNADLCSFLPTLVANTKGAINIRKASSNCLRPSIMTLNPIANKNIAPIKTPNTQL